VTAQTGLSVSSLSEVWFGGTKREFEARSSWKPGGRYSPHRHGGIVSSLGPPRPCRGEIVDGAADDVEGCQRRGKREGCRMDHRSAMIFATKVATTGRNKDFAPRLDSSARKVPNGKQRNRLASSKSRAKSRTTAEQRQRRGSTRVGNRNHDAVSIRLQGTANSTACRIKAHFL
jgi:hypothetical protein